MTDNLIREVNEALQQDRMHQLWKRYGGTLLYSCAAIVVLSGGMIAWQQREVTLNQERTALLMEHREAFMNQNYDAARDGFAALAKSASGTLATLARLWLAKSELMLENHEAALDALAGAVASDAASATAFEALACIQGTMLAPKDTRFEACLPNAPTEALYGMGREQQAVEAAVAHDFAKAAEVLPANQLPPTQQRRIDDVRAYVQSAQDAK